MVWHMQRSKEKMRLKFAVWKMHLILSLAHCCTMICALCHLPCDEAAKAGGRATERASAQWVPQVIWNCIVYLFVGFSCCSVRHRLHPEIIECVRFMLCAYFPCAVHNYFRANDRAKVNERERASSVLFWFIFFLLLNVYLFRANNNTNRRLCVCFSFDVIWSGCAWFSEQFLFAFLSTSSRCVIAVICVHGRNQVATALFALQHEQQTINRETSHSAWYRFRFSGRFLLHTNIFAHVRRKAKSSQP